MAYNFIINIVAIINIVDQLILLSSLLNSAAITIIVTMIFPILIYLCVYVCVCMCVYMCVCFFFAYVCVCIITFYLIFSKMWNSFFKLIISLNTSNILMHRKEGKRKKAKEIKFTTFQNMFNIIKYFNKLMSTI